MKNNKDEVILKYEQKQVEKAEEELEELQQSTAEQKDRIAAIQEKVEKLRKFTGKTGPYIIPKEKENDIVLQEKAEPSKPSETPDDNETYNNLYETAVTSLRELGTDPDDIDYHDLVSDEELKELENELNSGLPKEYKWTKSDYIVMFSAGFIGVLADLILSDRSNPLTGSATKNKKVGNSKFSDWLNEFHEKKFKHSGNAPIDYQGKRFGGGYHRELSKGHDLARFVEGIKMFKEGRFEAITYVDGKAIKVITNVNQYGNQYSQMGMIAAIAEYFHHMTADLLSTYSLPFPGSSFLAEGNSRRLRKFAADIYQNGFNCKNVILQSISTIIVELTVRIYFSIMSVKQYADDVEIAEDFSNWEAIKAFIKPLNKDKLNEMLLAAHAIVTAVNVGKIVIQCIAYNYTALAQINITEIMSVVRYGIKVTKAVAKRNDEYAKLVYHARIVNDGWEALDEDLTKQEIEVMEGMEKLVV